MKVNTAEFVISNSEVSKCPKEILPEYEKILEKDGVTADKEFNLKLIELLKERANFIRDIYQQGKFFYTAPDSYDEKAVSKAWKEDTAELLKEFSSELENISVFSSEKIHEMVQGFVQSKSIGFGKLMMPVRLAMVGSLQGPDVPVLMELLGKEEVLKRLEQIGNQLS